MNCEQFEQLIALQIEGDLPDGQQTTLSKHLSVCGSCHRFAEEIRDSQASLRSYTGDDFDEDLLAGIRYSVMAQIHSGDITLSRWERIGEWFGIRDLRRFVWAVSGAVAVVVLTSTIGLFVFLKPGPSVEIAVNTPNLSVPGSEVSQKELDKRDAITNVSEVTKRPSTRKQPHLREPMIASQDLPLVTLPSSEGISNSTNMATQLIASGDGDPVAIPTTKKDVTRIEMQTANPNIRIIWFVDKKPNAPPVGVLSDGEETKF